MRTGSLIEKSICILLTGAMISCAPVGSISTETSEREVKDEQLSYHSEDPSSSLDISDQVLNSTIVLSDQTVGLSIKQELALADDRFIIQVSGEEPVIDALTLNNPPRLVVDLLGAKTSVNRELLASEDSSVSSIRLGSHSDKLRIVFDLKNSEASEMHSIDVTGNELIISIPLSAESKTQRLAMLSDSFQGMAQLKDELAEEEITEAIETIESIDDTDSVALNDSEVAEAAGLAEAYEMEFEDITEFHNENEFQISKESEMLQDSMPSKVASIKPMLSNVDFKKSTGSTGEVSLTLSEEVAFELMQTSQSEYMLTLPGVSASPSTMQPLVSLKGKDGIRSVRVAEEDDAVLVRMFIDPGSTLTAFPRGNTILVKSSEPSFAQKPGARAQLDAAPVSSGKSYDDANAKANPTGVPSSDGSKSYTGRLISLDLQDTDIDNALRIIAEVSNLNIIASDDVAGKVTLRLIDVPWDQALDVILKTNGLDQVTEGNVIRIAAMDKLRREREAMRDSKRAAENLEDLAVKYIRVSYARADDIRDKIEAVLSERGTVTADERTNQLIIKDIKSGQKQAEELLSKLDLRTPQVLLETQIVEGSRTILRDLGFQWNFSYVQSPETGNATGLNFPNSVSTGGDSFGQDGRPWAVNFPAVFAGAEGSAVSAILDSADGSRLLGARLSALENEGKVHVVSRPQVATINNKQATIRSETTVRVRMPLGGGSIGVGAGAQAGIGGGLAFQEFNVGISLEVTPQASPDYYVLMDVNAKSSTFTGEETDNIPNTREREATSTILVKSGQTFALGGVYRIEDQDTLAGVPFLKDIPVLGWLFRRMSFDKRDEELIFFITPHIVEGSFDASTM
jgi:type IV pilus secretin PilQ/predicted competence protein